MLEAVVAGIVESVHGADSALSFRQLFALLLAVTVLEEAKNEPTSLMSPPRPIHQSLLARGRLR